jgi:predicted permease
MPARPPRLAETLLRRLLPPARRAGVLGDLHEEFVARGGGRRARRWYWREAAGLTLTYARAPRRPNHTRRGPMFDITRDLRTAWRALIKAPATSALIVVTLGVALGATTVGFAFADLAVIRGLPVAEPARGVFLFAVDPSRGDDRARPSLADFADIRRSSRTLERFAAFRDGRATLIDQGRASILDVVWATDDFFPALGQRAVIGRMLGDGDDRPGAPHVAMLSHRYWQEVYRGAPSAIGQTLQIGRDVHEIVGVATPEMAFGSLAIVDVWLPLTLEPVIARPSSGVRVVGRLRARTDFAAAAAEVAAIGERLEREHPDTNTGRRQRLVPIREATGGRNFWIIIGLFVLAAGLVLAIACVNVGNLLLVRATARRRELAVRVALGAPRHRIVRQMLVEGVLLSLGGALAAVPIAAGVLGAIAAVDTEPGLRQLAFDVHEVAFIASIALAGPLLFSLLPALLATRGDLRADLGAAGTRAVTGSGRGRGALVAVQLALAVVLLTVSGLAWRSAINLGRVENGIQSANLLKFDLAFDAEQYRDDALLPATIEEVAAAVAGLPGVQSVGVFDRLPILQSPSATTLVVPGWSAAPGGARPWAIRVRMRQGSLAALGVPLVAGEWPTAAQHAGDAPVAVISVEAARRYFGSAEAAVGQRLDLVEGEGPRAGATLEYRVAGVAGDVITGDPENGMPPRVWTPLGSVRRVSIAVKTAGPPADAAALVRDAVGRVVPLTPLEGLEPFDTEAARQVSSDIIVLSIFFGFAMLALMLATTGLYGVVSYAASRRTAEFATRFALGARPRDVGRMIVAQSMRVVAIGVTLGLVLGLLLSVAVRQAFFGVSPFDPLNTIGVVLLLVLVTLAASVIPARRAARTDLTSALRAE